MLLPFCSQPAHAQGLCPGDCNGNGGVTVDELTRSVGIALGEVPYRLCPPTDRGQNGVVTVDELIVAVNTALGGCPETVALYQAPETTAPAGPGENGTGVLPNGRRVDPAGVQVPLDTLPLNVQRMPDGRHLLVTNDGWGSEEGERGLQLVDTQTLQVNRVEIEHFFGLAVTPAGDRVFVANGDADRIEALAFDGNALIPEAQPLAELPSGTYPTGLAISFDGSYLYAVGLLDNSLWSIDLVTNEARKAGSAVGNFPYTVILSPDGRRAYVSSWGLNNGNSTGFVPSPLPPIDPSLPTMSSVAVLDLTDPVNPQLLRYIPIARSLKIDNRTIFGGSHPSAMQLSADGKLLFVTATNLDLLVVLDTEAMSTVAEIPLNTFDDRPLPEQLQGFYPNALALSPDGQRLYVAHAGINAVQAVDIDAEARRFTPLGFIPTGWFPSALALSPDGTLYVANGKGAGVGPNGPELVDISLTTMSSTPFYIGRLLKGSLSIVNDVDTFDLTAGSEQVRALNGFDPVQARWVDGAPGAGEVQRGQPVPIDFGSGPSDTIRHVVFILKENRTYDQVFGSFPGGDGDPALELFGEDVTPNHHALAAEFAMGDNFFADAEVSIPGHEGTDQGNSNDFTEKIWVRNYNGEIPDSIVQYGQEGFCKAGYIFQALENQGVPFRVYGEAFEFLSRFQAGIDGQGVESTFANILAAFGSVEKVVTLLPDLVNGNIQALRDAGVDVDLLANVVWPNLRLDYSSNILPDKTDVERAGQFLEELAAYEESGELPNFIFIWIPNDHTFGAAPNTPTPRSALSDNDTALGMIVDGLSHSSFWSHMAIFVTEDDAQDGQDHVSAHRTIGMVISPYVKRGYVSHVHHSNVSMLKTMELLLGGPPRSQYDRYALDMRDYFTSTPDLTPFVARARQVAPALNPTVEQASNAYLRRAAEISATLDLDMYDEAGENLSRVLWLVHVGERVEREKAWARAISLSLVISLLAGGIVIGRRRVRPASQT